MPSVDFSSGSAKPVQVSPARSARGGGFLFGWVLASLATVAAAASDERFVLRDARLPFAGRSQEYRQTAHSEPMRTELVRWLQRAVADAKRRGEPDVTVTRWQRALDEVESKPGEDERVAGGGAAV